MSVAQGHDHILSVPIDIGPLLLRVALLAAIAVVTGFAMLRAFLPAASRTTNAAVAATAACTVILALMLAGGIDIPPQTVALVLAALAAPLFLILSRDKRFTTAVGKGRTFAPWMLSVAAGVALAEFARGWLGRWEPGSLATILYTGVILALVGLSWFTVCEPRGRLAKTFVRIVAVVLSYAVIAAAAHATVLRHADSPASSAPANPTVH